MAQAEGEDVLDEAEEIGLVASVSGEDTSVGLGLS